MVFLWLYHKPTLRELEPTSSNDSGSHWVMFYWANRMPSPVPFSKAYNGIISTVFTAAHQKLCHRRCLCIQKCFQYPISGAPETHHGHTIISATTANPHLYYCLQHCYFQDSIKPSIPSHWYQCHLYLVLLLSLKGREIAHFIFTWLVSFTCLSLRTQLASRTFHLTSTMLYLESPLQLEVYLFPLNLLKKSLDPRGQ